MMKTKRVYLIQPNYLYDSSTYLPYAAGTLVASCLEDDFLREHCSFEPIRFLREKISDLVACMQDPFLVGFSNYVWNFEYNKLAAKEIKKAYPNCKTVFGGHHVSPSGALLESDTYIDFLIHAEGEEVFPALLKALVCEQELKDIPGISYRENGRIVNNKPVFSERCDYPSPYLTGVFDDILKNYPQLNFFAVMETNRGCPYGCSYCDWGNLDCKKVKFFPEEKVLAELKWLSDHGIYGFGFADANFGLFERDERITDEIVRLHKEEGVLKVFQTSYAKNNNDRIFRMTKKLSDCGMNKGVTLSYQSLSPEALKNVGRQNMPPEIYTELLKKYNNAKIPVYTELILGLPGETPQSLINGIDELLDAGQHNAIYIHNCEHLPCSEMGKDEYIKRFEIETAVVQLNQPHREREENAQAEEKSSIVVKTYSMTKTDWIDMNIYSACIQCFHHLGLLILPALYLRNEKNIKYSEFYLRFIEFFMHRPETVAGNILIKLKEKFIRVSKSIDTLTFEDARFGKVVYPAEEYAFLCIMCEYERFFEEIKQFLEGFIGDAAFLESLTEYQKNIIKKPSGEPFVIETDHNYHEYIRNILEGSYVPLKKEKAVLYVEPKRRNYTFEEYAKYIVWYGRKDSSNIYSVQIRKADRN